MLGARIDQELKDAARARDAARLTVLRALKSALKYREIELEQQGKKLDEAGELAVCEKQIKQRRDAAAQFTTGGRPELAANENAVVVLKDGKVVKDLR